MLLAISFFNIFQAWLVKSYFKGWISGMNTSKQQTMEKTMLAIRTYQKNLLSRSMNHWMNVSIAVYRLLKQHPVY